MSDQYVGEIRMFAGNYQPEGWAFCDGRTLPIAEYEVLFSLIGTTYGGDGQTNFKLPDLRGRVPLALGQAPGQSNYSLGAAGGVEAVTLNQNQYPAHTHMLRASTVKGNQAAPTGNMLAASETIALYKKSPPKVALAPATIGPSPGGSQPHENRQPYLAVNFIIALTGLYPSQG